VLAAPLGSAAELSDRRQPFDLTYEAAGTQSLGFLPLARTVHVAAHGNWPDPGFTDGFLPLERHIDARVSPRDGRFLLGGLSPLL
jgi:inner membrane protein involved in colicin E2 resistance